MFRKSVFLLAILLLLIFSNSCKTDCDCNPLPVNDRVSEYDLKKSIVQVNSSNFAAGFESYGESLLAVGVSAADSAIHAHICQSVINPVRFFDDESGYFFVETNYAWMVAHALKAQLIGTYRYDVEDIMGKFYVRDMVETIKYKGYGFVDYYFEHPETSQPTKKLAFVKAIPVADFFIGTGFYEYNAETHYSNEEAALTLVENICKSMAQGLSGGMEMFSDSTEKVMFCREFIDHIRFFDNQSGYFFMYDFACVNVAHGTQKDLQGQNLYNYKDSKGNYVIRNLVAIAKDQGSGYYEYYWNNPVTGNEEPKKAFVYSLPGIDYFIGSGIYFD